MSTIDLAALKPVIGTLSHNRAFSPAEITEYTRFDRRFDGPTVIRQLLRLGYVSKTSRGKYYPTSTGWSWLDAK